MRSLFLRLLLIDSLFGCFLVACAFILGKRVPGAAVVAIGCCLAMFIVGAVLIAHEAYRLPAVSWRRLNDVDWIAERLPGAAMLGTIAGFLLEASHNNTVLTVLTSTFVGVACWQALGLQHRLVIRETEHS